MAEFSVDVGLGLHDGELLVVESDRALTRADVEIMERGARRLQDQILERLGVRVLVLVLDQGLRLTRPTGLPRPRPTERWSARVRRPWIAQVLWAYRIYRVAEWPDGGRIYSWWQCLRLACEYAGA